MENSQETSAQRSQSRIRLQDVVTMGHVVEAAIPELAASAASSEYPGAQPGKRVVTKRRYMQVQGQRVSVVGVGVCMLVLGIVILSAAISTGTSRYEAYRFSIVEEAHMSPPFSQYNRALPLHMTPTEDVNLAKQDSVPGHNLALQPEWWLENLTLLMAFLAAAYVCVRCGLICFKEVESIDPGIPLTRANTGHLPAVESLVRAAVEPAQETLIRASVQPAPSSGELLRSVRQREETREEQLLRPAE